MEATTAQHVGPVGQVRPGLRTRTYTSRTTWSACIVDEAGTAWSFECGHLHNTADLAERCGRKLMARWAEWETAERVDVTYGHLIVELRKPNGTRPGSYSLTRMTVIPPAEVHA